MDASERMKRIEEEAALHMQLVALKNRLAENELASSAHAIDEGKKLFLHKRGVELADAIHALELKIKELEGRQ